MARISFKGKGTLSGISELLREKIPELKHGTHLEEHIIRGDTELIIFENYGGRDFSLSLSILLTVDGEEIIVDAVCAGEIENLFGFNWGHEDELAFAVKMVLEPLNFEIIAQSEDFVEPYIPPEVPDPEPIGDIIRRGQQKKDDKEQATQPTQWQYIKSEPERVKLGREEKKSLFGKKRNKPDWEY
ncbi:MAG: hypothetical protein IKV79_04330 [Oscillospiraceae bacterium]|nr:hypothetical protein [Oscillospiraceae bacterium]